jgi:hypothetical protein
MRYWVVLLVLAAVILSAGCAGTAVKKATTVTTMSATTVPDSPPKTPGPSLTAVLLNGNDPADDTTGDREFLDAVEICYNTTPVISDIRTNLEFTICMQHTPMPAGDCAKQFRSEILKYTTEDDSTTAGFHRETVNREIARQRYLQCTDQLR